MPPSRFVVCGDDPLAHRLVDELVSRYDAEVTVILPSRRRNHGPQLAALSGVRIVEADRLDADAFRAAKLRRAAGLALVGQDDAGNIHAALLARELVPGLRLVIRMFSGSLSHAVQRLFDNCEVLADARIATPELIAAGLGEVAPRYVRTGSRTLYVARRAEVARRNVVCGIAAPPPDGPAQVRPPEDRQVELVLAATEPTGSPDSGRDDPRGRPSRRPGSGARRDRARRAGGRNRRRPAVALWRSLVSLVDTKLEIAVLSLVAIIVGGVVAIGIVDGVTPWQALYTTVIIAADAGDPDLQMGLARQLTQAAVAVAGIAMVPVLTALVVSASVNARLAAIVGRLRQSISGHVVVIGLGDVGTRVIQRLHELGEEVVAIDKSESSRGAQLTRELGIPLVIGDASRGETLRRASVGTCRALLALSTSDVDNLGAAVRGRDLQPGLRVVLRLFDDDFARRVQDAFGIPISRSVAALTAPYFASALLGRQRVHTIAIERDVLLVTEVPVAAGSVLDGRQLRDVGPDGQVWVVALTAGNGAQPVWAPALDRQIRAGDRLHVVANQPGLTRLLADSSGAGTGAGTEAGVPLA